jgi:hypothetical protein
MRKRGTEPDDRNGKRVLITRVSGEGRRLFTRRRSRLAAALIWAGVVLGALCFIGSIGSGGALIAPLTFGCAAVVAVVLVWGLVLRIVGHRT